MSLTEKITNSSKFIENNDKYGIMHIKKFENSI